MIPDEAVEAAARVLHAQESQQQDVGEFSLEVYEHDVRAILEAAAPHMLSHEREQTRVAHLDAMVNRETRQAELAAAWDEGEAAGQDNAVAYQSGTDVKTNTYRTTK